MAERTPLLWRVLPDVRAGERSRFLFFAGLFTLISLAQRAATRRTLTHTDQRPKGDG